MNIGLFAASIAGEALRMEKSAWPHRLFSMQNTTDDSVNGTQFLRLTKHFTFFTRTMFSEKWQISAMITSWGWTLSLYHTHTTLSHFMYRFLLLEATLQPVELIHKLTKTPTRFNFISMDFGLAPVDFTLFKLFTNSLSSFRAYAIKYSLMNANKSKCRDI